MKSCRHACIYAINVCNVYHAYVYHACVCISVLYMYVSMYYMSLSLSGGGGTISVVSDRECEVSARGFACRTGEESKRDSEHC